MFTMQQINDSESGDTKILRNSVTSNLANCSVVLPNTNSGVSFIGYLYNVMQLDTMAFE